ncbi:hypothetical protein lilo_1536 [Lactococcus lactis subsp. lactis IO-1]|nr:hypothetical protein lilo_1536 [Lactococcus lactis subsp. lactis IO-1]
MLVTQLFLEQVLLEVQLLSLSQMEQLLKQALILMVNLVYQFHQK